MVSCIGATWIGNGLIGTLELMKLALKSGGLLLVGEPYWVDEPPEDAYAALDVRKNDYVSLDGTLDRFESAGLRIVEMIIADHSGRDRYEAPQWMAVDEFISVNPNDSDASALYEWIDKNRRAYLKYGRRYFNWGVFVLRLSDKDVLIGGHDD